MTIELRILSGARAGQSESFEKSVIAIGRHPLSDLRFDATKDIDVSARHGEIRGVDGRYIVFDHQSTNGTFVNGERVPAGGTRELRSGDVIAFGTHGPTVSVRIAHSRTSERVAIAVAEQTRGLRIAMGIGVVVLAGIGGGLYWMGHREAEASNARLAAVVEEYEQSSKHLQDKLAKTNDTALINSLQRQKDSLVHVAQAAHGDDATVVQQALERQHEITRAIDRMDLPAVRAANNAAVVLIRSDVGGTRLEASGFSVTPSGEVVTNRHVVIDSAGGKASRVLVKFADTDTWKPAHVVRAASDTSADLALLQVDGGGRFPAVKGLSSAATIPEGSTIASLGFPLGSDTPMEGLVAKTTLTPGTVSKSVRDVLQIDSYATHGSSGSPVLDERGQVVGVIYAGPREAGGRIVYAVPAGKVWELVGASALRAR